MGDRDEAIALYEKLAAARIDDALIADAVLEAGKAPELLHDREELVERLIDDDHVKVLRKEVSDVVLLVTAALEAPPVEVYRDFVAYVDTQGSLETFDEVTAVLRSVLARKMAGDALDDVVDNRAQVVDHLRTALQALGVEPADIPAFSDLGAANLNALENPDSHYHLTMQKQDAQMKGNPASAGSNGASTMANQNLPHISHPDVCDFEDVKQSHLGANLNGVEESDFDPID